MTRRAGTLLGIVLLSFWLAPALALAQKLRPARQMEVWDSAGKRVGRVISMGVLSGTVVVPVVGFKMDQLPFPLAVLPQGFAVLGLNPTQVVWDSGDCSGKPFLLRGYTSVFASAVAIGVPGNTVYAGEGDVQTLSIRSISAYSMDPLTGEPTGRQQCISFIISGKAFPARSLLNLDTEFRAPFTVR